LYVGTPWQNSPVHPATIGATSCANVGGAPASSPSQVGVEGGLAWPQPPVVPTETAGNATPPAPPLPSDVVLDAAPPLPLDEAVAPPGDEQAASTAARIESPLARAKLKDTQSRS
jgi:hypothetical protein